MKIKKNKEKILKLNKIPNMNNYSKCSDYVDKLFNSVDLNSPNNHGNYSYDKLLCNSSNLQETKNLMIKYSDEETKNTLAVSTFLSFVVPVFTLPALPIMVTYNTFAKFV